jgi:hypothetical protein
MWGLDERSGGVELDREGGRAGIIAAADTGTDVAVTAGVESAGSTDPSDRADSTRTCEGLPSDEGASSRVLEAADSLKNGEESRGVARS